MRILYNALLTLLIPFAIARLLWKSRRQPGYRKHIGERFAVCLPSPPAGTRLWVHAVSVGEFIAIRPLLEHLLKEKPELSLWLTCTTPTGREQQLTCYPPWLCRSRDEKQRNSIYILRENSHFSRRRLRSKAWW